MKRKLLKSFLGLAAAASLFLTGCSGLFGGDVDTTDSTSETTTRTSTAQSTYTLNEDGTVTFKLGSSSPLDSIIRNSRTIAPENPSLYYTVYGATVSSGTGDTLVADYATALTSGDVVTDVWYPTTANITSGIEFTIGVSSSPWYFTAIGTYDSPATIIAAETTPPTEDEDKIAAIDAKAVVRGTLALYIVPNSDGTVTFTESATSTTPSSMVIETKSCSSDKGSAIIPVSIPATNDGTVKIIGNKSCKVGSVKLTLTKEGETTAAKEMTYTLGTAGAQTLIAFNPTDLDSGTYDVYLSVVNAPSDASTPEEIYYLEDKLYVLPAITSYVVKGGTALTGDVGYQSLITGDDASAISTTASSSTKTGYIITTEFLKKFRRHVFYVTGSGGALTAKTGVETGSMFAPFTTVKGAADAIGTSLADGTIGAGGIDESTDWRIIIDGVPTDAATITFTNSSARDATLRILKYSGTGSTVTSSIPCAVNFTATKGAGILQVCLANITLSDAVEIGTPELYILNTKFTGTVKLDKEATYKDGTINALSTDTTSSATDITLEGSYGYVVVNHLDETSTIDIDGDGTADAATATTDTFKTSTTWATQYKLNATYIDALDSDPDTDPVIQRVLQVGTDNSTAGATTLGDLIVKVHQNSLSIKNKSDLYGAKTEVSVAALTTANVGTEELTFTFSVYGKNSSYPASGLNPLTATYTVKTPDSIDDTVGTPSTSAVSLSAGTVAATDTYVDLDGSTKQYDSVATGTAKIKLGTFSTTIASAMSTEEYVLTVSYKIGDVTYDDTYYFTVTK